MTWRFSPTKLRKHRTAAGMAQDKLGRRLDVHAGTVLRWENGTSLPRTERVCELASVLGVAPGDLFEQDV